MSDIASIKTALRAFGRTYAYDTSYLVEILEASPDAYRAYAPVEPMSGFRQKLPVDAHFVARVAAMRGEDCGACTQLNLRMAAEAGVDRSLLRTLLESPHELPGPLRDVHEHARAVAGGREADPEAAGRIRTAYGEAAFAELAICIAGCRIFPTLKRAMLHSGACELLTVDF